MTESWNLFISQREVKQIIKADLHRKEQRKISGEFFSLCFHCNLSVHMYVCGACTCAVYVWRNTHVCTDPKGGCQQCFYVTLDLTGPGARLVASRQEWPYPPMVLGLQAHGTISCFVHGLWGFEFRSSCSFSKLLSSTPELQANLPIWLKSQNLPGDWSWS